MAAILKRFYDLAGSIKAHVTISGSESNSSDANAFRLRLEVGLDLDTSARDSKRTRKTKPGGALMVDRPLTTGDVRQLAQVITRRDDLRELLDAIAAFKVERDLAIHAGNDQIPALYFPSTLSPSSRRALEQVLNESWLRNAIIDRASALLELENDALKMFGVTDA